MNKNKYSLISHTNLPLCNPMSNDKIDDAIRLLDMKPNERAVDFGAGKGEFLIRLIERFGISATAVELEGGLISDLQKLSQSRISSQKLKVVLKDAKDFVVEDIKEPFDVGVCIGSTGAFGGYNETLSAMRQSVKPGGQILLGDLYWKKPPHQDFLAFLGATDAICGTHESNILQPEEQGLVPLWAWVATQEEFDTYEWRLSHAVETYVREHPEDPDTPAMIERSQMWRRATLKWGRETWGFGLYLFRNGR